jgi:hypothetical protein
MKKLSAFLGSAFMLAATGISVSAQPIGICPDNPHYYYYKGKPIVLITSAEHYGAVINKGFDYIAYLNALQLYKLNYTRIYPGYLIEPDGLYIAGNTLAPGEENLLLPWRRSGQPGYNSGGNRFDLNQWDQFYFDRLHDFIRSAYERGIIVEICFFNAQSDKSWAVSAFNAINNCQGIGKGHFNDAQTLTDTSLVNAEIRYVSKIVREVNGFDNIILEVCDETTVHGTPLQAAGEWTRRMIGVIKETERGLPKKHLIAQQVIGALNGPGDLSDYPDVSVIVGQYVGIQFFGDGRATYYDAVQEGGIQALDDKYTSNKPIEFNETNYYPLWYKGDSIGDSRVEAWEFIAGGGAGFNQLNSRFTVDLPDGNTPDNLKILSSLKFLTDFINGVDFIRMKPDKQLILPNSLSDYVFWRALSLPGKQYIMYMHHSFWEYSAYTVQPGNYKTDMEIRIPPGRYRFEWVDPGSGKACKTEVIQSISGTVKITTPEHAVDIAMRIDRID